MDRQRSVKGADCVLRPDLAINYAPFFFKGYVLSNGFVTWQADLTTGQLGNKTPCNYEKTT